MRVLEGWLHGRVECLVGYIHSSLVRVWMVYGQSRFIAWGRGGMDGVKGDGEICVIRSGVVRRWTLVDGTILAKSSVFDTSLTRGRIN